MKRKNIESLEVYKATRSKKPQLVPPFESSTKRTFYVSGTDVRNYMIRDTLVDWLKLNKKKETSNRTFFEFITRRGNEFEQEVVKYFKKNGLDLVTISDTISSKSCKDTILHMKLGTPIIHSAPFQNKKKHIKGIIDFLVRSDYLHNLVQENPLPENLRTLKANNLSGNYHYVVVDSKFSTLPLRSDGIHLLNSGAYPSYKAQLWIYTNGISDIQGYVSRYAFILGRRWNYVSHGEYFSSFKCFDKLGTIDYEGIDKEYIQRTVDAINWLKDLHKYGKLWSINPPSRNELYPNMCVDSKEWNKDKKQIADQLGDITQLWYCGIKNREKALMNGLTSWRDSRCSSDTIGITGVKAPIINKIININRQNVDKIRPSKITTRIHDWDKHTNEIFVDFETFCDIFATLDDIPEQPKTDKIFMIGVWFKTLTYDSSPCSQTYDWVYMNFVTNAPTYEEEYRIMDEFAQFVKKQGNPKLWYWHADKMLWEKAENRQIEIAYENGHIDKCEHIVDNWNLGNWADLCKVFRSEPIVVKDCFRFGLKEIAGAMYNHGLINIKLDSTCSSGLDAGVMAWKVYESNKNPANDPIVLDIAKYNEFDVSVLHNILFYLRRNHL